MERLTFTLDGLTITATRTSKTVGHADPTGIVRWESDGFNILEAHDCYTGTLGGIEQEADSQAIVVIHKALEGLHYAMNFIDTREQAPESYYGDA